MEKRGVRGRKEGEGCERVRDEGEGSGVIEEIGRNREREEGVRESV